MRRYAQERRTIGRTGLRLLEVSDLFADHLKLLLGFRGIRNLYGQEIFVLLDHQIFQRAGVTGHRDIPGEFTGLPGNARREVSAETVPEQEHALRVDVRLRSEKRGSSYCIIDRLFSDCDCLRLSELAAVDLGALVVSKHGDAF